MKLPILIALYGFLQAIPSASAQPPVKLISAALSRICNGALLNHTTVAETEFLTSDPEVCVFLRYTGGNKSDKLRFEWVNPLGTVMQTEQHETPYWGPDSYSSFHIIFKLAGNAAAQPGEWKAKVFYNDAGIVELPFRISAPSHSELQILSKSVMPSATAGAAYLYRFSVSGGEGPYGWNASGDLPPGLSFSPAGALSGVPSQQGPYQFSVTVHDARGDALRRTVAIGVAAPPKTHIVERRLAGSLSGVYPCAPGPTVSEFTDAQPEVSLDFTISGPNPDRLSNGLAVAEWMNPLGEIVYYSRTEKKTGEDEKCYRLVLPLATQKNVLPGNWRVRLMWAGGEAFSVPFVVTSAASVKRGSRMLPGRWALAIGNSDYRLLSAVPSAGKDAAVVEKALQADGFDVTSKVNLDLEGWRLLERDFTSKVESGGVAVVYYSGHALHVGPEDWLVPTDYDPGDTRPLSTRAYSLDRLRQLLEEKNVALKILFLSAPMHSGMPKQGQEKESFAPPKADPHTVVCVAAPASATDTATGGATAFARAVAKVLTLPDSDLRQLDQEMASAIASLDPLSTRPTIVMPNSPEFKWGAGRN